MTLHKLSDIANRLTIWSIIVLTIGMSASVFTQITARNIFSTSFEPLEELSRYLLVWVTFLGAAITYKADGHMGVLFFINSLPNKLKKKAVILANIISLAFFVFLIYYGHNMASLTMGQESMQMRIPMGIVYSVIPLSGAIMVLHAVCKLRELFASSRETSIGTKS